MLIDKEWSTYPFLLHPTLKWCVCVALSLSLHWVIAPWWVGLLSNSAGPMRALTFSASSRVPSCSGGMELWTHSCLKGVPVTWRLDSLFRHTNRTWCELNKWRYLHVGISSLSGTSVQSHEMEVESTLQKAIIHFKKIGFWFGQTFSNEPFL